jgi:HAD superfamily hydrolase (TIGR01509 family)
MIKLAKFEFKLTYFMQSKFGVIFDMDGVMVDSNPMHKIALAEFCGRYGLSLSEEELVHKVYGRTNQNWISNVFGPLPPAQIQAYAQEKERIFRELYQNEIKALDGLLEFLNWLKSEQIPCAIGTSAPPENVSFVLEHTQTQAFFATIIDDSQIERSKPDPQVYLKASAALGFEPGRCIVFEDSLSGVQAGLAAGCKVIGISTTHSPEDLAACHAVLPDFKKASRTVVDLMA